MQLTIQWQTIVLSVGQILLMGFCGYMLTRKNLINEEGVYLLARLLVNFFLPLFMFTQLVRNFDFVSYPNWWIFPLIGIGLILLGLLIGKFVFLCCPKISSQSELLSLVAYQNSGYLPLIMVTTIFQGELAQRFYVCIFLLLIGFDFMVWSTGVWLLTKHKRVFNIRGAFSPPLIAMLFSLLIISLGWHQMIPQTIFKTMKMFGDCTLPLAMLVIGGNLAEIRLKDIKKGPVAATVFGKLIVLPLVTLGIILFFKIDSFFGFLILLEAVVPSAVTLSIITRYYEVEEQFVSQGIFFTHVLSVVTMPVFLILYANLLKG